jgi:uncharacterized protein
VSAVAGPGPTGPFAADARPTRVRWLLGALAVLLLASCCGVPVWALVSLLGRFGHAQEYMSGYRRASEHPIIHAAMLGDLERVSALLDQGIPIDERGEDGRTVLHWAAFADQREVVALLLSRGADVRSVDSAGATPLHLAAAEGHAETVTLLLGAGADPLARTKEGQTPLEMAVARGHSSAARVLREWPSAGPMPAAEAPPEPE